MPARLKSPELKTGHSKGRKERPTLGLVPAKEPMALVPKPPAGLLAQSKRIWTAYWASQVSGAVDADADMHRIHRWIMSVDEYERVLAVFRKERVVQGSQGQPVINPLASYLQNLETNISRAESEMGLTPMARLKLGITFGQAQLTAAELNRMLDGQPPASQFESIEGDWEAV